MSTELSEYEKIRQKNILRNDVFLKSIGLATVTEKIAIEQSDLIKSSSSSKRVRRSTSTEAVPVRRSTRATPGSQNVSSIGNDSGDSDLPDPLPLFDEKDVTLKRKQTDNRDRTCDSEEWGSRISVTAQDLRMYLLISNPKHNDMIKNQDITNCTDRMSYMSSDALTTRIKAISSGKGEQSKIKMLTFYYALQAGNLLSLAAYSLEMSEKMDQNLYFELTNGLRLPPERTDYCSIEIKDENNLDVKDSKQDGNI